MIETCHYDTRTIPETSADEALAKRVGLFLASRRVAGLWPMDIDVSEGVVTVEGVVRSYYERQLAVACIQRVAGVLQVVDLLRVRDAGSRRG
jgi:osmotically-inducible protein OsmY